MTDLAAILAPLRRASVEIEKTEDFIGRRFAWCHDPEGNRSELYEDVVA